MPRVPRRQQWTEAACYHVITRGHNRETLFADEADFRYFLELLGRYRDRFAWQLYHYCLMSNPVHLLVRLVNPGDMSRIIAGLLRAYIHYFNGRYGFVGHLFQGRFKSPAIEAESYLLSCGRYIERNPLEARLAVEPWQYPWSSCRAYALGEADPLVSFNPSYLELALEQARRQQRWREFLLADDPKEGAVRQDDWAVGGGGFRQRPDRPGGRPIPRLRGRPRGSKSKSQPSATAFSTQPTLPFEEA